MRRPHPILPYAALVGLPEMAMPFDDGRPSIKTGKGQTHGAAGTRSKAERKARRAKRRQRSRNA